MKKRLCSVLILLLAGFTISAQIEKGSLFLNGLNVVSFQSGKHTVKYGSMDFDSETNSSSFTVGPGIMTSNLSMTGSPTLNYAFTNQLSTGVFVMLSSITEKDDGGDKEKMSVFMIGPSIRCFVMKERKFLPFVEAKTGFGSLKYGKEEDDKYKLTAWYGGTGATWYFFPKAGIDFTLGYQSYTNKSADSESNFKGTNKGMAFSVGVLVGF